MKSSLVVLVWFMLAFGCLVEECIEVEPYGAVEYYNETVPLIEEYCRNMTHSVNMTDYSCSNFTYNESYTEEECIEKQMKYTPYSIIQTKICDATYTPDVNWDPICLRGHYECSFKITNVDSERGEWTFGMNANVTNGSYLELDGISKDLSSGKSGTFEWSIKLESLEDNITCNYRIISIPRRTECVDVWKNRTVTKQECLPIGWIENVTEVLCSEQIVGYEDVVKNRTVTRYRNVSKPC
ncbi:MAG: hypothetical protein ABIG39_02470 [Candidatus Micrarchaeota archaeon]